MNRHRHPREDDYDDYRHKKRFRSSDYDGYYEPSPADTYCDTSQCTLYVGNIPVNVSGEELLEFLNQVLRRAGWTRASGDAAVSYRMNLDKHFCYVQFRSDYEARQALRLDNIHLHGHPLEIRPLDESTPDQSHSMKQPGSPRERFKEEPSSDEGWMRTVHYKEEESLNIPGPSTRNVPPIQPDDFGRLVSNIEQSCKVRVRHVPLGVTEEEIREFFNYFMKLTGYKSDVAVSCRMTKDVAIVQFDTALHAQQALNYGPLKFKGTYLAIEPVSDEPMAAVKLEDKGEETVDLGANDNSEEEDEVPGPIKIEAEEDDSPPQAEGNADPECTILVENVHAVTKEQLRKHLNKCLRQKRLVNAPGIIKVEKTEKDNYSIVQFKSPELATAALGLDGVNFRGHLLKVVRLTPDFIPNPRQNVKFTNADFNDKLVISNLPNYMNRKHMRFFIDGILERKRLVPIPKPCLHMTKTNTRSVFALTFRSKEDARQALKLDGLGFGGRRLHFRKSDVFPAAKRGAAAGVPAVIPEGLCHIVVINYPRPTSEEQLRTFLNKEMQNRALNLYPGDAIWPAAKSITPGCSPAFAFAIFRSVDDATKGLGLDGIIYKGHALKVSRPRDYKPLTEEEKTNLPPVPKKRLRFNVRKLKKKNPELFDNGPGYSKGLPLHPAYKLYIGDLPDRIVGDDLRQFLNEMMREKMASEYNSIRGVKLGLSAKSTVFQVRTFSEAKSAATHLDQIVFEGRTLSVKLHNVYKSTMVAEKGANPHVRHPHEAKKAVNPPPAAEKICDVPPKKAAVHLPPAVQMSPNVPPMNNKTVSARDTMVSYHTYYQEPSIQSYKHPDTMGHLMTFQANSFSSKYTWSISTWNVMGAVTDPAVQAFMDETLFGLGMDLIAFQETGLPSGTLYTKNYKWYMSNSEDGIAPGVGFLLRRDLLPCAYEFNPKGGNLAHFQIKTAHQNLALASVYVPPASDPNAPVVLDELKSFVSTLCSEDHILLLGDFNAEIGHKDLEKDDHWFIGQYLTHTHCNKNGIKLKAILHHFRMYLVSTQQDSTMLTWSDAQTDHVVANCNRLISSIRSIPMPSFRTYHKLLRASVRFTACDQHSV